MLGVNAGGCNGALCAEMCYAYNRCMHAKTGENKPPKSTQLQTSKYMPNTSIICVCCGICICPYPGYPPPNIMLGYWACLRVEVLGYCASGFGGEEERRLYELVRLRSRSFLRASSSARAASARSEPAAGALAERGPPGEDTGVSSSGSGASVSAFVPVMPPNVLRMSSEKAVDLHDANAVPAARRGLHHRSNLLPVMELLQVVAEQLRDVVFPSLDGFDVPQLQTVLRRIQDAKWDVFIFFFLGLLSAWSFPCKSSTPVL
ncbi:hypothetical protein KCU99_g405, partial [Aureobasidium melanogenum]